MGALTAPVTATLRAGSSITQGVAATATSIGQIGRVSQAPIDTMSLYSRFRPPRYISSKQTLTVFDEDLAMANQIFTQVYSGRYSQQPLKYFTMLPESEATGEVLNKDPQSSIVFITDQMLIYCSINDKGIPRPKLKSRLRKISDCEVFTSTGGKLFQA